MRPVASAGVHSVMGHVLEAYSCDQCTKLSILSTWLVSTGVDSLTMVGVSVILRRYFASQVTQVQLLDSTLVTELLFLYTCSNTMSVSSLVR